MNRFPEITFTTLQDPDEIDRVATEAALKIVDGQLSQSEGRMFIGGLLFYSKMPTQEAHSYLALRWPVMASRTQVRNDLTDRCIELLQRKINDTKFFDVAQMAAGKSFTGWCRNFLNAAPYGGLYTALRSLSTAYNKAIPSSHRIGLDDETVMFAGSAVNPEESLASQSAVAALAAFADQVHGAREQQRLQLSAAALSKALDLPRVKTLPTHAARKAVEDDLKADPKVAYRVVSALCAGILDDAESPLAQVFAHFTQDDLETLVEKDWRVTALLANAAAAATPPVVQRVANDLICAFVQLVQAGSPEAHMAKLTVRAWLDTSTTMIGDEFSRNWTFKPDKQVADEAAEFTRQATRLVRCGRMPGMVTVADVERWLETTCEQLQVEHAARVSAGGRGDAVEALQGNG